MSADSNQKQTLLSKALDIREECKSIPMQWKRTGVFARISFVWVLSVVAAAYGDNVSQPSSYSDISSVTIESRHLSFHSAETNLILIRSNGLFVGAGHEVPELIVSNLLAGMRQTPRTQVDPVDLGLTPDWLETNRHRLLTAFGGQAKDAVFPLASPRQRAWLTNALFDLELLKEVIRKDSYRFWSDDLPRITVLFSNGDREVARLHSRVQHSFMLPWEVTWGTNTQRSCAAGLSRGVAALLPEGFLNRKRVQGDLFAIITDGFASHSRVQAQMKQMTLEETLGMQTERFLRQFELKEYWMPGGSYGRFPENWRAKLHRTNWPAHLFMPVHAEVRDGVVDLLPPLFDNADTRVQPILQSAWLMGLFRSGDTVTIEVAPDSSISDDRYLRRSVAKVSLGEFYEEMRPLLEQGLAFRLRERAGRQSRASSWIVLPDQEFLLMRFAGDGVLGWSPEDLGLSGSTAERNTTRDTYVAVFVSADGQIEKVIPQAAQQAGNPQSQSGQ